MTGRKVYRASSGTRVLGWVCAAGFFLVGVVTAVGSPGHPGKGGTAGVILGVAVGVLVTLFSVMLGAVMATNSLIVTPARLIHRDNLRSLPLTWPAIESFTVGPSRTLMRWPALVICLRDDSRVVTSVISFTARYPAMVARELTAMQADSLTFR